jgi:hypothetical protein
MRFVHRLSLAAVALAISVPATAAGADFYLKLGGVKGESADKDHKNWIDVQSVSWGETMLQDRGGTLTIAGSSPPAGVQVAAVDVTGDGRARGRPVIRIDAKATEGETAASGEAPLGLATPLAQGSITLLVPAIQRCRVGESFPAATVEGGGKRYRLKNLVVTECRHVAPAANGQPMVSISFNYTKISW